MKQSEPKVETPANQKEASKVAYVVGIVRGDEFMGEEYLNLFPGMAIAFDIARLAINWNNKNSLGDGNPMFSCYIPDTGEHVEAQLGKEISEEWDKRSKGIANFGRTIGSWLLTPFGIGDWGPFDDLVNKRVGLVKSTSQTYLITEIHFGESDEAVQSANTDEGVPGGSVAAGATTDKTKTVKDTTPKIAVNNKPQYGKLQSNYTEEAPKVHPAREGAP